ncbi:hypothetical protein GCM10014719_71320 [Planomonospora parontospora subsp. antibiotica]|nr:hypothetical protein GCM10014719_71320 [Planomonospora parontospora subsp. antibiotica]GII20354.1 hypothetical protein Ppa05_70800 [Planomonospora parontospora subsp. antibiotica]
MREATGPQGRHQADIDLLQECLLPSSRPPRLTLRYRDHRERAKADYCPWWGARTCCP